MAAVGLRLNLNIIEGFQFADIALEGAHGTFAERGKHPLGNAANARPVATPEQLQIQQRRPLPHRFVQMDEVPEKFLFYPQKKDRWNQGLHTLRPFAVGGKKAKKKPPGLTPVSIAGSLFSRHLS